MLTKEQELKQLELDLRVSRQKKYALEKDIEGLFREKIVLTKQITALEGQIPSLAAEVKTLQSSILTANGKLRDIQKKSGEEIAKSQAEQDKDEKILEDIKTEQKVLDDKKAADINREQAIKDKTQAQLKERHKLDQDGIFLDERESNVSSREKSIISKMAEVDKLMAEVQKKIDDVQIVIDRNERQTIKIKEMDAQSTQMFERAEINLKESDIALKSANEKKVVQAGQQLKLDEREKAIDQKQDTLRAGLEDLETKKQDFEIIKLRFEKLAKDQGRTKELEKLKKELGK